MRRLNRFEPGRKEPSFYGSVSRDCARLHLRFVHEPPFVASIVDREQLVFAFVEVEDIKSL
jgi:hypothetical protein